MLTAFLFVAALAASEPGAAEAQPSPAQAAPPANAAPAGLEDVASLTEDDLATEAAQVTNGADGEPVNPAEGGAQLAQQPSVALDRSRIENFTPPPPEPVAAPSLGGFGFAAAFGR